MSQTTPFQDIDTSPLAKRGGSLTRAIRESPGKFLFHGILGSVLMILGLGSLAGLVVAFVTVFRADSLGDQIAGLFSGLMSLTFTAAFAGLSIYVFSRFFRGKFEKFRAEAFAEKNGFNYQGDFPDKRFAATVFSIPADGRTHENVVTGRTGEYNIEFGDFTATSEYKSSRSNTSRTQTVAKFGYLAINLGARAPYFILDSTLNGRLKRSFAGYEKYELEGDFPQHFTTWVPKDGAREMLEMMSPDVMLRFSDYGQAFDFELRGTLILIVANRQSTTRATTVNGLLYAAAHIVPSLKHKALRGSW